MTLGTDERAPAPTRRTAGRRAVWLAIVVAIGWLVIGSAVGPLSGKLSEVQTNDNASFLPASAESTVVAKQAEAFADQQSLPGLIVITRPDGAALTADDLAASAAFAAQIPTLAVGDKTIADYVDPGPIVPIPSQDGKATAIEMG